MKFILNTLLRSQDPKVVTHYMRASSKISENRKYLFTNKRAYYLSSLIDEMSVFNGNEDKKPVDVLLNPQTLKAVGFVCEVSKIPTWLKQYTPVVQSVTFPSKRRSFFHSYSSLRRPLVSESVLKANLDNSLLDTAARKVLVDNLGFARELVTKPHELTESLTTVSTKDFIKLHNSGVTYVLCVPKTNQVTKRIEDVHTKMCAYPKRRSPTKGFVDNAFIGDGRIRTLLKSYGVQVDSLRLRAECLAASCPTKPNLLETLGIDVDTEFEFDLREENLIVDFDVFQVTPRKSCCTANFRLYVNHSDLRDFFRVVRKGETESATLSDNEVTLLENVLNYNRCSDEVGYSYAELVIKAHEYTYGSSPDTCYANMGNSRNTNTKHVIQKLVWNKKSASEILSNEDLRELAKVSQELEENIAVDSLFGRDFYPYADRALSVPE